jgi:hypothetical protein
MICLSGCPRESGPFSALPMAKSSRTPADQPCMKWPIPRDHIAIMISEKLATNMTIEVNAAMSRTISVISALLARYVSYLFYFCSRVNGSFSEFVAISPKVLKYG